MIEKIKQLSKDILEEHIAIRRHLHAHPELSFQEFETSKYIYQQLQKIGITKIEQKAGTGWVALIEGKNPESKTVALRADIDALPIVEQNNCEYKSTNIGVMHACGHDVHTTCLLGATQILYNTRDQWSGTVKILFQPGEEQLPGGASMLIKEGALQNPTPEYILGQHVMPLIPAGKVGFREGLYMASTDELYITVKGKGGHGAMPHLNIDPVLISAHMIVALQQLVSRMANPIIPTVLSFGKVIANGATNVIPDEVKIEGTFRTLDETWRKKAHIQMKKLAESLVEGMGGTVDFDIQIGYPFLYNDVELTRRKKASAIEYMGAENVIDLDIWMAAEDFSFYSQVMPACFYRLGTRNEEKGITASVHNPKFDIDESAIEVGIGLMAWLAACELQN
ncbi:MAG: amidohydrolase [Bacteroidetes bacterium]|nr:amidohydrolase [Bacteroidota bacterium]